MFQQLTRQLCKIVDLNFATAHRNICATARLLKDGKFQLRLGDIIINVDLIYGNKF